jgi:antagonist of KipI
MSLRITRAGILDTIQDLGRWGYQSLGINPGGVMDGYSAQLCNILVGNEFNCPVIELHFPASTILFDKPAMISIGGADFDPVINDRPVPMYQPILINKNVQLRFLKKKKGARSYLAVKGLAVHLWLNSASTNIKIPAGGYQGRAFKKGDVLELNDTDSYETHLGEDAYLLLPWKADHRFNNENKEVYVIPGNEWNVLDEAAKTSFLDTEYRISNSADRMGYQLEGAKILLQKREELVSSGVGFGTVQLLPNGQLIILMADHQTTGGYPRLAHIISAHLPLVAQKGPGEKLTFRMVNIKTAEDLFIEQQQHLLQLQNACKFRLAEFFS